jgi:hypothetical protein
MQQTGVRDQRLRRFRIRADGGRLRRKFSDPVLERLRGDR